MSLATTKKTKNMKKLLTFLSEYTGCNRWLAAILFVGVLLGTGVLTYFVIKYYSIYQMAKETAVGMQYKEISMPDINGNVKNLSEVVKSNKLTLVDFWASWCGPCRAEMPNVKKVYDDYHDKGFEVYGVSLDDKVEWWKDNVAKLGALGFQVSDLKGWSSDGATTYGVSAIPATVLIDQNGNIIAKNLRGDELVKKVSEILDR